ncbi:MAG: hypothetical protein M1840_009079 [Geoglossum simile]|nr:MAG: hypothetical protein M1840_009079 [Geoglossum simile]
MGSELKLKMRFLTSNWNNKDVKAIVDISADISVIILAQVKKIGVEYDRTVGDVSSLAGSYEVVGWVRLDCRATEAMRSQRGHHFYVVKKARAPVVLGKTSPLYPKPSKPVHEINVIIVEGTIRSMSLHKISERTLIVRHELAGAERSQEVSDRTEQQATEFDEESAEMARERRELRAKFKEPQQSSSQPQQSSSQPPRGSDSGAGGNVQQSSSQPQQSNSQPSQPRGSNSGAGGNEA